jgi:NADP-dependent 3-hydroxy acid dehydrogenase YdfG
MKLKDKVAVITGAGAGIGLFFGHVRYLLSESRNSGS